MPTHCYIHIPFCEKICSYCDFCKLLKNNKWIDKYLLDLEKEIDDKYKGEIQETIYIGGGTPSALNKNQLEKLFKILAKLKKSKNVEYTIEGNYESTTSEKLDLYKKYGINRLSFGIETTHKKYLDFLNRTLDKKSVTKLTKLAKEKGFNNINVDLIYAIPGETKKDLVEDLDYILSLDIEHISTYSLIIEENTLLKVNNTKNINTDMDFEMYKVICKCLKNNNYKHYEISNFSKEGYESKHNLCYWNNEEYYGFGLGASSYINGVRLTNSKSLTRYAERIVLDKEIVDSDSIIEYEIILNLRKTEGINLEIFRKKYHKELIDIYDYSNLLDKHLLELNNNHLYIPEDRLYVSNSIINMLLECKKDG